MLLLTFLYWPLRIKLRPVEFSADRYVLVWWNCIRFTNGIPLYNYLYWVGSQRQLWRACYIHRCSLALQACPLHDRFGSGLCIGSPGILLTEQQNKQSLISHVNKYSFLIFFCWCGPRYWNYEMPLGYNFLVNLFNSRHMSLAFVLF